MKQTLKISSFEVPVRQNVRIQVRLSGRVSKMVYQPVPRQGVRTERDGILSRRALGQADRSLLERDVAGCERRAERSSGSV
jgi:hypothetical protein